SMLFRALRGVPVRCARRAYARSTARERARWMSISRWRVGEVALRRDGVTVRERAVTNSSP
ncbi:MAG: hypothetical protein ACRDS9_26370, partial [Pseudonocardiaceae bacterium]